MNLAFTRTMLMQRREQLHLVQQQQRQQKINQIYEQYGSSASNTGIVNQTDKGPPLQSNHNANSAARSKPAPAIARVDLTNEDNSDTISSTSDRSSSRSASPSPSPSHGRRNDTTKSKAKDKTHGKQIVAPTPNTAREKALERVCTLLKTFVKLQSLLCPKS